jgi:hypothetical protein
MPILDVAHNGAVDVQDKPLTQVGTCPCGCKQSVHFGDEDVWEYDGDLFPSAECFAKWSGARRMDGIWS